MNDYTDGIAVKKAVVNEDHPALEQIVRIMNPSKLIVDVTMRIFINMMQRNEIKQIVSDKVDVIKYAKELIRAYQSGQLVISVAALESVAFKINEWESAIALAKQVKAQEAKLVTLEAKNAAAVAAPKAVKAPAAPKAKEAIQAKAKDPSVKFQNKDETKNPTGSGVAFV